jgi:predicted enzyme related to lactoylglutathione lyase
MTEGIRKPGEFCWFNILTPAPAEARAFFGTLLGWTFSDVGMGHLVQVAGHAVGAMHDLSDPRTPKGTPPTLGLMVKVDRVDEAAERVLALGGERASPVRHRPCRTDVRLP